MGFIDGSYAKALTNIARARQAIALKPSGKSRAGNTTKIHLEVDAYGRSDRR